MSLPLYGSFDVEVNMNCLRPVFGMIPMWRGHVRPRKRRTTMSASLLGVLCLGLTTQGFGAGTYYVDAAMPNDSGAGTSWATAKQTIQAAIDLATTNDLVLVTNGVYDIGGRVAASMTNRVALTNSVIVQAVSTNPLDTLIVGAPDTVGGAPSNGPSAIRGVYVGPGSQLTGFTVSNGYTTAGSSHSTYGGGIYAYTNTIISNCIVVNCRAAGGGGIYAVQDSLVVCCNVAANYAAGGGGISTLGNVYFCNVVGNTGTYTGGAAGIGAGANSIISNCLILENVGLSFAVGGGRGGRFYNCNIVSNNACDGGGLYLAYAEDCLIQGNTGRAGGGANVATLVRCRIIGNTTQGRYGAVNDGYLTNCLVAHNISIAPYIWTGAGIEDSVAVNCTIVSNNVGVNGASSSITNCIVYDNKLGDFLDGIMFSNIGYTCARTNTGTFQGTVNIITNNPLFVDSTNGNFRLTRNSPCFNSGINQDWMTNGVDMDGNPRICNVNVDMGAYEYTRPRGTIITILGSPAP